MIAVDTNILVYAHRREYEDHPRAVEALRGLASGPRHWTLPWPCVHEFLANVTRKGLYKDPTSIGFAFEYLRGLMESASFVGLIGEAPNHLRILAELSESAHAHGGMVHDARIAAICIAHGVAELWTADRDFLRFPQLNVRNPLVHV